MHIECKEFFIVFEKIVYMEHRELCTFYEKCCTLNVLMLILEEAQ